MSMDVTTFESVLSTLKKHGYEIRSYSGRGMYGKECLAVTVDSEDEIYKVQELLTRFDIGTPRTDRMGQGYVVYYESIPYNEEDEE